MKSGNKNHIHLSLCMIVKNEAEVLEECLERVEPIVEEMIIVDTGSVDDTKIIAQNAGANIFDFKWQNDFSAARNYSLKQANGKWILVLDADEFVSQKDLEKLLRLTYQSESDGFRLCQRSYTNEIGIRNWHPCKGEYEEEKSYFGYVNAHLVRLFKNDPGIYFEGEVHEVVEPVMAANNKEWVVTGIPLHHYGFTRSKSREEIKKAEYEKLGKIKINQMPEDPRTLYDLGVQLINAEKYKEAVKALERAYRIRPDWIPLLFSLGRVWKKLNDHKKAIDYYNQALNLDPYHKESLSNLAIIYEDLKRWDDAGRAYKKCLDQNPEYLPGMVNLATFYQKTNRTPEALFHLEKARNLCPNLPPIYKNLGLIYGELQDWKSAEECYLNWIKLDKSNEPEGSLLLADASIHLEDWDKLIAYCDRTLYTLNLPRNVTLNNFHDLSSIYEIISKDLKEKGLDNLSYISQKLRSDIYNLAQIIDKQYQGQQ